MRSLRILLAAVLPSIAYGNPETASDASAIIGNSGNVAYGPYVMAGIDKLHAAGITGKGIKIAIVGPGVDYKHAAFGGCFGKGCVISGGYDFVGDDWVVGATPKPKADPLEVSNETSHWFGGIGTRAASMIVAQPNKYLNFTGVAPGAQILAYKITGRQYRSSPGIMASAIDRAVKDGAHIIVSFTEELLGIEDRQKVIDAASRAIDRGVPVLVGIDSRSENPGSPPDFFKVDAISGTKGVETTIKFETNTDPLLITKGTVKIGDGKVQSFWYQRVAELFPTTAIDLPLYALSLDSNITNDACQTLPDSIPDLGKYMVLVRAGGCALWEKAYNLKPKNGHKNILVYNDKDAYWGNEYTPTGAYDQVFEGVVPATIGEKWVAELKKNKPVTVHVDEPSKSTEKLIQGANIAKYGGAVRASYYGPSQSLDIKPIYGAPSAMGVHARLNSGFEMSDVYGKGNAMIAGAYALIAQARNIKPTPKNIQNLLANTAKAQLFHDGTKFIPGVLAPVAQQGAGLIQVFNAAYAKSSVTPATIAFNDTAHAIKQASLVLVNHNQVAVTYSISNVPAKTIFLLNDGYNDVETDAVIKVALDADKVTIQPGKSATIKVTPPADPGLPYGEKLPIWSGYVTINGTDGTNLAVPYLGVQGSQRDIKPFSADPYLYNVGHPLPVNGTMTLGYPGGSSGGASLFITRGVPIIEVYLQSLDINGQPDGRIDAPLPPGPYQAVIPGLRIEISRWDGVLKNGVKIPEGPYRLKIRGLRLFGDATKDEDWQVLFTRLFKLVYYKPT